MDSISGFDLKEHFPDLGKLKIIRQAQESIDYIYIMTSTNTGILISTLENIHNIDPLDQIRRLERLKNSSLDDPNDRNRLQALEIFFSDLANRVFMDLVNEIIPQS